MLPLVASSGSIRAYDLRRTSCDVSHALIGGGGVVISNFFKKICNKISTFRVILYEGRNKR